MSILSQNTLKNIRKNKQLLPFFICFILLVQSSTGSLQAQAQVVSKRKREIGGTISSYSSFPGTALENVLKTNLGLGLYYRINWPHVFLTELGAGWVYLGSRKTQSLLMFPIHLALGYPISIKSRLNIIPRLGTGVAYVEVRPANVHGWDPLLLMGLEISVLAARFLRIGIRFDYIMIYERHLDPPENAQSSPPVPDYADERFQSKQKFEVQNGHFLRFNFLIGGIF